MRQSLYLEACLEHIVPKLNLEAYFNDLKMIFVLGLLSVQHVGIYNGEDFIPSNTTKVASKGDTSEIRRASAVAASTEKVRHHGVCFALCCLTSKCIMEMPNALIKTQPCHWSGHLEGLGGLSRGPWEPHWNKPGCDIGGTDAT